MSEQPSYQEQVATQRASQAEQAATELAQQQYLQSSRNRVENPEFLAQLTDTGFQTEKYDWMSEELPGLFARPNFIAERDASYETEAKWLNQNRVERKLAMHNPGRLTKAVSLDIPGAPKYPVLEIAQGVHNRTDKEWRKEFHPDARQALRHAGLVATNFHSNAVGGAGRRAVSEATAVSKVEKQEEKDSLRKRAASGVFG